MIHNLNRSEISNDEGPDLPLENNNFQNGGVSIYFRDIENQLIEKIKRAESIFGCVAWLTNRKILEAMWLKKYVSIVVQKEDFLKPDIHQSSGWKKELRDSYSVIGGYVGRPSLPLVGEMSYCNDPDISGVRCVGNSNQNKKPSFPRMHNKFLVFANSTQPDPSEYPKFIPISVWTGSFNFSHCATQSFENAVYIQSQSIAESYFKEFCQILALSEPLDWESEWMQPEWRIGS